MAADAYRWPMSFESPAATTINGVIYQYTVEKDPAADLKVHIQNKDTQGPGYIFRETDDWSGLPGESINKMVVVPSLPASRFGEGSIETEGQGRVLSPNIAYTFRINPDLIESPQIELPDLPDVPVYDALNDENVDLDAEIDQEIYQEEPEKEEEDEGLERELAADEAAIKIAGTINQAEMLRALNLATNINAYYAAKIEGGEYQETVQLQDSELPDNERGLRNNLAQQVLHAKMVDMQWR